jgi:hypothetical protein
VGFLATNRKRQIFVVVEMLESPAGLYSSDAIGLMGIANAAFQIVSPEPYQPPR